MLVRDIDRKLDMRVILRVRQNTELFDLTREIKGKFPVFLFGRDGETWMSTYFPKETKSNKLEIALKKFRGIEKENSFVIDSRINNVKDLKIINKLMEIPSFIINRSDMNNGFLNVYARFHSSQLPMVSENLSAYTEDMENSRVEWLGPNPGIMKTMDLINSEYPVSVVTYTIRLNGEDRTMSELAHNVDSMAEIKNSQMSDGRFKAVLYSNSASAGLIEGVDAISKDDGIFELETGNDILANIRDASNSDHIMRLRYFVKPRDGNLEVTVFLPSAVLYEYYSVLYNIARKMKGKIIAKYILPYSHDIWEFI
ncbi:MAG: hypothetical protein ACYCT2_03060 [Thermoplasmataceae archaeon]